MYQKYKISQRTNIRPAIQICRTATRRSCGTLKNRVDLILSTTHPLASGCVRYSRPLFSGRLVGRNINSMFTFRRNVWCRYDRLIYTHMDIIVVYLRKSKFLPSFLLAKERVDERSNVRVSSRSAFITVVLFVK